MPNEFIVKNGLISQGNITISGSITATGGVTVSGSIASASYASNAELLDGLDSTVFTLTSSFNAQTASFTAFTSSMNSFSASILTNVTALNAKTASFATTGSNTFVGAEVISGSLAISGSGTPFTLNTDTLEITGSLLVTGSTTLTGSLLQLGNFTTTGTIIAQTINVQTVTSSIVYSSGSNVFGNSLGNSQVFTGSVLITGSLTIAGASSATSYNGATIFGSTIACSPIGCFATSCATSFIGGTMSGTTIYGSTAVCAPTIQSANVCTDGSYASRVVAYGSNVGMFVNSTGAGEGFYRILNGACSIGALSATGWYKGSAEQNMGIITGPSKSFQIATNDCANSRLTIGADGVSVFACQVCSPSFIGGTMSGTTIYGSTTVCSPVGYFSGCVGIGTINPGTKLEVYRCETDRATVTRLLTLNNNSVANPYDGFGMGILFKGTDYSNAVQCYGAIDAVMEFSNRSTPQPDTGFCARMAFSTGTNGALTERMRISSGGNVGIGTCSPCAKLHINGSTGASTYKGFAYTYAGSETLINEVLFQAVVGGYSSNLPIFLFKDERSDQGTTQRIFEIQGGRSGVGTILTTLANGNVGIGTSVPDAKLHICNAVAGGTNNYLIIVQNCCTVADARAGIAFSNNSQTPSAGGLSGASIQTSNNGVDGAGNLLFSTLISGTNCERMRITSAGATIMYNNMAVVDGQEIYDTQTYASNTGGTINFGGKYNSAGAYTLYARVSGRKENATDGNTAGYLLFTTKENGGGATERMRITSGGLIGMNQPAPSYRLEICSPSSTCLLGLMGASDVNIDMVGFGTSLTYPQARIQLQDDGYYGGMLSFFTKPNGAQANALTERMRICSNGDLTIKGNTHCIYTNASATISFDINVTRGRFYQALTVDGTLTKGGGSFKIDHPLESKKDTYNLYHSFVESPKADLIYRGKVALTDGYATVNIDTAADMSEGTFEVLVKDVQCFTTNENGWNFVKGTISGNILTIESDNTNCNDEISWMVIGERNDKWFRESTMVDENGKTIVEKLKSETT